MASLLKGFFGEPGDFYEEGAPAYPDHTEAVREARPYKDLLFEESGRPWEGEYVVRRMPSQELGACWVIARTGSSRIISTRTRAFPPPARSPPGCVCGR